MDVFPELVLKLNVDMRDHACRRKVLKVLSSIIDTYYVSVDWKTGFAHIGDLVDINLVLQTLAKSGYKAEIVDIHDWPSKSEYKSEVVDNWTTKSEFEAKVANAGYQREEVDRTTRLFGRHRIDVRKPHHDPYHHLFNYASPLHSRYGYELAGGHNSRTGCTHHHHCHGRNGCALPLQHGINHCHRPLPPCHYDSQIGCTHNHHHHGQYGYVLPYQHGTNHCHHNSRIGCNYHHHDHCTNGCVFLRQHNKNHCHRPHSPCHHDF